ALAALVLERRRGGSLGLVGVNGAGKTTLVTLLAGMREPTGGRITVDGRPLSELDPGAWQRQVAVVYQDFARLPFTAAENVAPAGAPDPERLQRAAVRAGAERIVERVGWDARRSPRYHGRTGPGRGPSAAVAPGPP